MISENLIGVKSRIAASCRKAGRNPLEIEIVCVTKGIGVESIREALRLGVRAIGESRVQEALTKRNAVGGSAAWHLIGHLQTNKVPDAVHLFSLIHSVDSLRLARAIDQEAEKESKVQDVLVQVNISGEKAKFGVAPEKTISFLKETAALAHVRVTGLMGIARFTENPEDARSSFGTLRTIFTESQSEMSGAGIMRYLSMGMSHDFEVAVEEGANVLRIGTAIFRG